MKKQYVFSSLLIVAFLASAVTMAFGQERTTITGTAVIYGSGRNVGTTSRTFTLTVKGQTSPEDRSRYLSTLADGGQNALRDAIRENDLGRFSLGASVGNRLEAVVVDQVEGKTRVRAVFERWIGFGELRGGYRSVDYPFGYIEVVIDPKTGKGDGTFFPAARIRFKAGKNGGADTVEIEDFGTWPSRLMGVVMRGRRL